MGVSAGSNVAVASGRTLCVVGVGREVGSVGGVDVAVATDLATATIVGVEVGVAPVGSVDVAVATGLATATIVGVEVGVAPVWVHAAVSKATEATSTPTAFLSRALFLGIVGHHIFDTFDIDN